MKGGSIRPQEGKQKILKAAQELFIELGCFSTTVSLIAKKAGVSKGLIYNYYESKDELLKDLFENYTNQMKMIALSWEMQGKGKSPLEVLIDNYLKFLEHEKKFLKLQLYLLISPELESVIGGTAKVRAKVLLKEITKFLKAEKVQGAESEARILLALLDGIALHYLYIYENYPLNRIKSKLRNKIIAIVRG